MKCSHSEDLVALLDGELPASRARSLREHIEKCSLCREEAALLKRSYEALDCLEAPEVPARFVRRVRSRAQRRRVLPMAAAAGLLLTIGLFYAAWQVRSGVPHNGTAVTLSQLSPQERAVIENFDILENFDLLADMELLDEYEILIELERFPEIVSLYENEIRI